MKVINVLEENYSEQNVIVLRSKDKFMAPIGVLFF